LQAARSELAEEKKSLAAAEKKFGSPFPQENELSEKIAERNQIQAALAEEGKEKPAVQGVPEGPLAERVVRTDAFKLWFGNSKVVNADGSPMVVYHGTNVEASEIKAFSRSLSEDGNDFGRGIYFTSSRADAERNDYNRDFGEPQDVEAYEKIENPYIVGQSPAIEGEGETLARKIRAAGYDGIIDPTVNDKFAHEGYQPGEGVVHYIAFDSRQVKSIDNLGTFDPTASDIRFSRGPAMGRREFLAGATAATAGFMFGGKLYAKPAGLTALLHGSLNKALDAGQVALWIAENSENADWRRLAKAIAPMVRGAKLRSVTLEQIGTAGGGVPVWSGNYAGEDASEVPSEISTASAHGVYYTTTQGEDVIWLARTNEAAGIDGWNERTAIHELLHAALDRYYGQLSIRLVNPVGLLREEGFDREAFPRSNRAETAAAELGVIWRESVAAFEAFGLQVEKGGAKAMSRETAGLVSNALTSPDEFIAYATATPQVQEWLKTMPSKKADERSLWQRFVDAIRSLFGAGTVKRSALDDVLDARNALIDEAQGQAPLPAGRKDRFHEGSLKSAVGTLDPTSPAFGPGTEERWKEAKKGIGGGPGIVANTKEWFADLASGFARHHRYLPNETRFSNVAQQLRKLEAAPDAAMEHSLRYLRGLVAGMDAAEYDLFARKVVLDDLAWDAGNDRDLPFGFTPETLTEARRNVDLQVNLSPKLVAAVRNRKAHNKRIADAMVKAGVLTRDQIKNPAYFRHMVLEYARAEAALARSPSKVKSPYWAKRMGSALDINANLLEAELDWLMKAQVDIATAKTIDWIKASPLNVRDTLRDQARADNRAALAARLARDPVAAKEDGHYRSLIARGFALVKGEIEAGHLDPIPDHLQGAADAILTGSRDGDPPYALFAWMLDGGMSGAMGAGMVLKYTGLRKQFIRKLLGTGYVEPDDIAGLVRHYKPEGMTAWQPKEGRHLFTAKTVSEHTLDMFVDKLADTAAPGLDRAELASALGTVRSQLVVGGERYTMIIPKELSDTLDEFGDRRAEGMVAHFFGGLQSAWKRWVLINPRRWFKYNLNNMTGDLDAIIAGNPGTLRQVGRAWRMLRDAAAGKIDPRHTEALERGVFTSGLSAQEIPDINRFSEFRHLTDEKSKRPDKLLAVGIGKVWRVLQDTTNFREALFRLAAYLDYVEKIESGMPQVKVGYGASVPRMVDAVSDPRDKAALLARDLVGDYGSISVAGSWLRKYLVPFWSWMEIIA
jgi:hypothetical protein